MLLGQWCPPHHISQRQLFATQHKLALTFSLLAPSFLVALVEHCDFLDIVEQKTEISNASNEMTKSEIQS